MTTPTSRLAAGAGTYLLRESILLLVLAYLLLLGATSNGIVYFDLMRLSLALLSALVLAWLAAGGPRAPTPLAGPLLTFLGAYLAAGLLSVDPRRSLPEVWLAGAEALAFGLTLDTVRRRWPGELFVKALLLAGTPALLLGWYAALDWYRRWLETAPGQWLPAIAYRLPVPNTLAIFVNLLTLAALARLTVTRERLPRLLLGLWTLAGLGLLILTSSRGGWVGFAAGAAVLAGLSVRERLASWRGWVRFAGDWRIWASALALLAAGAVLAWRFAAPALAHPTHGPAASSRDPFWGPAWQGFLQRPFAGWGPATYGSLYVRANSIPPEALFTHAHSVFFNLLAETGLLGLLPMAWLAAAGAWALRRALKAAAGADRGVVLAAAAGMAAYAVHGLVETVNAEPSNALVVAVLMGAALAPGPAAAPAGWTDRWPAALGLVLAAAGWYGIWLAAPVHAGAVAAQRLDWPAAAEAMREAVRRDPASAIAHQQLGLAESMLASGEALALAQAGFEAAARIDPDWPVHPANLGAVRLAVGDANGAVQALREAARRSPRAALFHLNLGLAAEQAGDLELARVAYKDSLDLRPDWAGAYFWRAETFRDGVAQEWITGRELMPEPGLAELEAALAADPYRSFRYTDLARAYLQAGRLEEADRLLRQAELAFDRLAEDRLERLWWQAETAAARLDWVRAAELGELALAGIRSQSAFGPGTFPSQDYGPYLFRRETMPIDLVPQLVVIGLTDRWAARLVRLGDWYAELGDLAQAGAAYQETLSQVPDHAQARARLGLP